MIRGLKRFGTTFRGIEELDKTKWCVCGGEGFVQEPEICFVLFALQI